MINIKSGFNKLLQDIKESSPNLRNSINEISPISFCINITGHRKIFITLNNDDSDISFEERKHQFEIKTSLIELLKVVSSGKMNKNLINGLKMIFQMVTPLYLITMALYA